ncbi:MAG: nucleotidyltransferase domain-containing protein [Desulfuromonadales bacterium]|nr:nucleotidyltransferase domain-containing protein [Desulfuromonadales bacterium]
MLSQETEHQIVEALRPLAPERVILFGSHAWGEPDCDSDLDLYVVTSDDEIPQNFRERSALYQRYAFALEKLYGKIAIDLIVHTRVMHRQFVQQDSLFCRKIMTAGIPLI